MYKKLKFFFIFISFLSCFSSCRYYTNNLLFKTKVEYKVDSIDQQIKKAENNYLIRKNDYITFKMFTNQGEVIVDPSGTLKGGRSMTVDEKYIVHVDGTVILPMIGTIQVVGLSLPRLDSLLSKKFEKYYQDVFVISKITNKRVIMMGAFGNRVIPIENENMSIIEVLASSTNGSMSLGGASPRYYNIRVIRGDLKNPSVTLIDLTSIESMIKSNLNIQPNDIIYIEPKRKVFLETLGDITPVFGLISSLVTIYLLFASLRKN